MPDARAIVHLPEIWGAAYLEDAKLQFSVPQPLLGEDGGQLVLTSAAPEEMYRLPRRNAVRVRRDAKDAPTLRFQHPRNPAMVLSLKLIDLSATGCALAIPVGMRFFAAGSRVKQVEVELDHENIVFCDLVVRHVRQPADGQPGRAGCEWAGMPAAAGERLQQWIQRGRRRRELISLSFG